MPWSVTEFYHTTDSRTATEPPTGVSGTQSLEEQQAVFEQLYMLTGQNIGNALWYVDGFTLCLY